METRAAVAHEAGKPLTIETVTLAGPKAGEVLVEIKATGICHTDEFTLSGADPEGLFPAILGHEGAGVVVEVGADVTSVKPGDHVIPLYTPECRQCEYCLSGKTNLCQAIRETQGRGVMPDGTSRFHRGRRLDLPLHGHVDVRQPHGTARDRGGEGARGRAFRQDLLHRVRRHHRHRCGHQHRHRSSPARTAWSSASAGSGSTSSRACAWWAPTSSSGSTSTPPSASWRKRFGMTHFVNPSEVEGDLVPYLVDLTRGGADYSFECIGNVEVMRQALECCHKGWGESIIIGVAGAGQEIATRPFQLVTGRVWRGTAFGGAKGRTEVPRIVDWYMDGKINIDDLITHTMPLEDINRAFDLMHAGESIRSVVQF